MNATCTAIPAATPDTRMRILDILAAPRFANSRTTRWTATVLFGLLSAGALAGDIAIPDAHSELIALVIYALGVGCLWMLWLSGLLLVARDGHRLCLPGVVRNTAAASVLYASACVAAPVAVTAATGGNVSMAVLWPALAIAASVTFVLLPRYIATWFCFLPAIYIGLHNVALAPSPLDPRFQQGAWLALAVFAVIDVIRWRQLLHGGDNDASGWRSTMLMQFRQNLVTKDCGLDRQWALRRSENRRTDVDFRSLGPAAPVTAIRVALGGWYVPQTVRSRLGALARAVLPLLLFIPLMWLMNVSHAVSMRQAWNIIGVIGGLWIGVFGTVMLAFAVFAVVRRRWRHAAGMELLALLPGVGGSQAIMHVMRAIFTGPAVAFVVLGLCLLVPTALIYHSPMTILLGGLFLATTAALTVMAALRILVARPLGVPIKIMLGVLLLVLADGSFILATMAGDDPWSGAPTAQWLAVLGWLAVIGWAAWQSIAAWRMLQRRPHPFLANPP